MAQGLQEKTMRIMTLAKLKLTAMTLCAAAFFATGGGLAAETPQLAEAIKKVTPGKWTEICKDGGAGCFASGTVYMSSVNALISWGTRVHSAKFSRHDTCHFDLGTAKIIDALPPGKEAWKPKALAGWRLGGTVGFYEREGVRMPQRVMIYEQLAWDGHKKRVVYFSGNTFTYDPAKRAWTELKPKTAPPYGLQGATMCYDAESKKIVLFGGFGVEAPEGRPGTWYFDCEKDQWSKPGLGPKELGEASTKVRTLGKRARTLRRDAQYLMGLLGKERKKAEEELAAETGKLHGLHEALKVVMVVLSLRPKEWPAQEDEARLAAATKLVDRATAAVGKARGLKGTALIAALEEAEDMLVYSAVDALRTQPPPRCNADMVYDSRNKLVVLFGGNHLDFKMCDTWVLDTARNHWTQRKPKLSPPPQSTHSMAYLEKSGRVFLASHAGNWTYDAKGNAWKPVAGKTPRCSAFRVDGLPGTDTVIGLATAQWSHKMTAYAYRVEAAAAPTKHKPGKPPLSAPLPKTARYSRKWYDDLPAPDPAAFAAKIKNLPENVWTPLKSEKQIRARTWSSCTFDSKRRELIYWGGGHSGNVNSNVDHFSMRTGRWSRNLDSTWKPWPYGAKAACPQGRTYYDEPWTMHARKTYAYDPISGKVIMAFVGGGGGYQLRDGRKGRYTWIYDPRSGGWPERIDTPFRCGYNGAAVTTPKGVMLLDRGQMWKLDLKARKWAKVGPRQKMGGGEYDTMVYDSKRDRLVYLAGKIHYFPLATQKWEAAKATGIRSRDAVYVPSQDVILAHVGSGKFKLLLCADEKIADGPAANFKGTRKGISEHAVTMDPATETILWIDANGFCGPFTLKALKLNVQKLAR
jgi:Galactose oxidase, central domain